MTTNRYKYSCIVACLIGGASLLSGCADEAVDETSSLNGDVMLRLSLDDFEGDAATRTTKEGTAFEGTETFRMQIICPHSSHHENGEPWTTSYHTIELPKATKSGTSWVYGTVSSYEAQATTYIYSAQNTIGNRIFVIGDDRYVRPSNFFYADQSKLEQLKKSDVVWAQAIRHTGAREVHLNFKHKVAKLDITIDDSKIATKFTNDAILTIEGMPDIDGAEIVVGDYYADDSYQDESFSYRQKASCSYENNGKVLGIEVIDDDAKRSKVWPMSGNPSDPGGTNSLVFGSTPVPNNGVYTAYHDPENAKRFILYVPACDLDPNTEGGKNAVFWLREGTARYSVVLDRTKFEEGVCYKIALVLGDSDPIDPARNITVNLPSDVK